MSDLRYTSTTTVDVTLAPGETLGAACGPGTTAVSCTPGLAMWDAITASGLPIAPLPRMSTGAALRDALKTTNQNGAWELALSGQSQDTRDWWTTRYGEAVSITAKKLVRVAATCAPPVDLDKLFTAAGA